MDSPSAWRDLRARVDSLRLSPTQRKTRLPAVSGAILAVLGVCAAATAAYLLLSGPRAGNPPAPAPAMPAANALGSAPAANALNSLRTTADAVYEGSGRINSDRVVAVSTKVSGEVVWIDPACEQGNHVKAGQTLARIENTVYASQHAQAQAEVALSRADQQRARAQLERVHAEQAQAALEVQRLKALIDAVDAERAGESAHADYARWNLERMERLAQKDAVQDGELRLARAASLARQAALQALDAQRIARQHAVDAAIAQQNALEASVQTAQADVLRAAAALDGALATEKLTAKRLADTQVNAPIDGVILTRHVEMGDFVAAEGGVGGFANSRIVRIADLTRLRVEVDVAERDIRHIRPGMPCIIIPAAAPDRHLPGEVMWIDPSADYSKAQVQVKVRILESDPALRVEGSARVRFGVHRPGTQPASN